MTTSPDQASTTACVTLRYWASARAAAGVESDPLEVTGVTPLAELLTRARTLHAASPRFAQVLSTCSVMVGDRPVTTDDPAEVQVPPGATVEFLPPFAGGLSDAITRSVVRGRGPTGSRESSSRCMPVCSRSVPLVDARSTAQSELVDACPSSELVRLVLPESLVTYARAEVLMNAVIVGADSRSSAPLVLRTAALAGLDDLRLPRCDRRSSSTQWPPAVAPPGELQRHRRAITAGALD